MAQFAKFLLLILCQCIAIVRCTEEPELLTTTQTSLKSVTQLILDAFNDKWDAFTYHSPSIINIHRQNESDNLFLIHIGVSADCKANSSESCTSSNLLCEVLVIDDPATETKQILDGYTLCANKELELQLPISSQGFIEIVNNDKNEIALPIIKEFEQNDPQRSVVDIMSLKKLEENSTLIFLTLKTTKNDEGDSSKFEVCELQVNQTDNSSEKECFSLESNLPNILLSGDDMTDVAKEAVQELDNLSLSKYMYTILGMENAEKIVTPGSEGVMTSLELRVARSVCLKRSDSDELSLERACIENNITTGPSHMLCSLVRWDRPWKSDTLYSVPVCHLEEEVNTENIRYVEGSSESSSESQPMPVVEEPIVVQTAHCTGCPTDLNLDNPALQLLTEQALTRLDAQENVQFKHALVRIVKAQKQVVSGVKYVLVLEVGETGCLRDSPEERSACSVEQETRLCAFEFLERPWLQQRPGQQLLHSNCTNLHDDNLLDNEIQPNHVLESSADRQSVLDYIDTAMDQPFQIRDSPSFVEDDTPSPIPYGDDGLVDTLAEKQLPLESSEEAMMSQPKVYSVANSEESGEQLEKHRPFIIATRQKREGLQHLLGGLKDVDPAEEQMVRKLADVAVNTLDELDIDDEKRMVISVNKAQKQFQVSNEITYHLEMQVGLTSCSENVENTDGCSITDTKICYVQLLKSFASTSPQDVQVVKSECFPDVPSGKHHEKRSTVVGGPYEVDVIDEHVVNVTNSVLLELDQMSSSQYRQKIVRVVNATKQVVAGVLLKVYFELGPSNCLKTNDATESSESCELQHGAETQICSIKVWDRPWIPSRSIEEINCRSLINPNTRRKRASGQLVGAPKEVDVNSSYIQEMVALTLTHLDETSNSPFRHHLIEVTRAQTQIVAGTLIHLVLRVGHSTCRKGHGSESDTCVLQDGAVPKECTVEIWDRPWEKKRTINSVTCNEVDVESRSKRSPKIGGGSHDIHYGEFYNFMQKFNKNYKDNAEMKKRFHIFRANMIKAKQLQETEQGTAKYGASIFADLSAKEFRTQHLGLNLNLKHDNHIPLPHAKIPNITLPKEFDWRHYNVVTEVKNQGMCGSCWAFSVTGNVEGQYAIKYGTLLSLSEQELVDCDKLDAGCNGGLPENAYKAIEEIGGLEMENDYPYEGDDEKCHFNLTEARVKVNGGVNITSNETQMAQWLVKNGPISIGINANAMQLYMGGVSHPWKFLCSPDNLDHGVLIVGYGVHTYPMFNRTMPFWTIKNSWGPLWGEQGYYRVYRGDGTCGVNMMATSAVL